MAALDRNKKSLGFRRLRNSSEPVSIHRPRGGKGLRYAIVAQAAQLMRLRGPGLDH
eukprot:COSAG02_NODE_45694_length_355_cov_0.257812_1_plen_55_part_10